MSEIMEDQLADVEARKRLAATAAVDEVREGMIVGLGTGSTARHAVEALAHRVATGLKIEAVATSVATAQLAETLGIRILDFSGLSSVDLAIDGVDEIDAALRAIKGAGGAMLREKVVASAARRMVAIADGSKLVGQLGQRAVPMEVLPFARAFAEHSLTELGGMPDLRKEASGAPYTTNQGNYVLDTHFGPIPEPAALAAALDATPGIVAHGLFLSEIDAVYIAGPEGVRYLARK